VTVVYNKRCISMCTVNTFLSVCRREYGFGKEHPVFDVCQPVCRAGDRRKQLFVHEYNCRADALVGRAETGTGEGQHLGVALTDEGRCLGGRWTLATSTTSSPSNCSPELISIASLTAPAVVNTSTPEKIMSVLIVRCG